MIVTGNSPARSRAVFWVTACVVVQTLWTSAAPAMSYAWYARAWHLDNTTVAGIFAVYPVVVVSALVAFSGMSDSVGRRTAVLSGLLA